jgi:hypothetical protein
MLKLIITLYTLAASNGTARISLPNTSAAGWAHRVVQISRLNIHNYLEYSP